MHEQFANVIGFTNHARGVFFLKLPQKNNTSYVCANSNAFVVVTSTYLPNPMTIEIQKQKKLLGIPVKGVLII